MVAEYTNEQIDAYAIVVRDSQDKATVDDAMRHLLKALEGNIDRIVCRYKIKGLGKDDIRQECLIKLVTACKRFDPERQHFAALAHVAMSGMAINLIHASKKRRAILNRSQTIDKADEDGNPFEPPAELASDPEAIDAADAARAVLDSCEGRLLKHLSKFEARVYGCYAAAVGEDEGNNYERVVALMRKRHRIKTDFKAVDNALLRIRKKAAYYVPAEVQNG